MAAPSELTALRALGAALREVGAAPAPVPARARPLSTHELAAGVERLRALLADPEAAPSTHGLTPEQLAAYAARYSPEAARRSLGRTGGYNRPQCAGCRACLKHAGAQCSACGFMDGGGYLAVPAKTSHLERWR